MYYLCLFKTNEDNQLKDLNTYTLSNGLRVVALHNDSKVSHCGLIVDVGSRDETDEEQGMVHLIEHMLFKGTKKRRSTQIINRLEDVGGELNAFTSKEETLIFASFLSKYSKRVIELLADIVQNSNFPNTEIEKEIEVIKDEIQSYLDTPSELIFDDFEELIYKGNSMSHSVLGLSESLDGLSSTKLKQFYSAYYQPQNMVFFYVGDIKFDKLLRWVERYFDSFNTFDVPNNRIVPNGFLPINKDDNKDTFQIHNIIGSPTYNLYSEKRMGLYLLNNILGGPGMNSLLNLSLRERNALVYHVESNVQHYTDSGWWGVYYATDPENYKKCNRLVKQEIDKLRQKKITEAKLERYKTQLIGQMALSNENKENIALSLAKSFLRYGHYESDESVQQRIMNINSEQLLDVAQELFIEEQFFSLKYY